MAYVTYTTPKGKAFYPNLRTPNVYEGEDLGYDCKLILPPEEEKKMAEFLHKELAKAAAAPEFAGKNLDATDSFIGIGSTPEGETFFKFKTKSTYKTKSGDVMNRVIPIFDAKGKPLPKNIDVGHGSVVRVNYSICPFWKSRKIKGLTLILNAVQVLELVERGKAGFGSFGFQAEENGYSAPDEEVGEDEIPFKDAPNAAQVDEGADF